MACDDDEDGELTAFEQAHMLAGALLMAFRKMSSEQRSQIIDEIKTLYCLHCGDKLGARGRCYCQCDD